MAFFHHSVAYDKWTAMVLNKDDLLGLGKSGVISPLWIACKYGLQHIVDLLLQEMSLTSIEAPCGSLKETPLMCATTGNQKEIVRMLLAVEGVNVNIAYSEYYEYKTPLWKAVEGGYVEIVRKLLAVEGVDVNQACSYDATPLWTAAEYGNVENVRMLLAVEAVDANNPGYEGDTPLLAALKTSRKNKTIIRLLRQALEPNLNPNPAITCRSRNEE